MRRSTDRCSSRMTRKKTTRNLELGGGLAGSDGGDNVMGSEEVEKVPAKGGRTHCSQPHEVRNLLRKSVK